ncbi:MAG: ABC transporter permease [Rhizobacter sp.]|nr:ABC transporter permease [Chlorobiales bacterium]
MLTYILRRLAVAVPLIFGALTLVFFLIRLAPGDPTSFFIAPGVSPNVAAQLREQYGLNDPLPVQYFKWLGNIVKGDFGNSFSRQQPVLDVLGDAIPTTLMLAILGLTGQFVIGILLGVMSAVRQGTAVDRGFTIAALFIYSMPEFWLGLMLIIIFALKLGVLPASNLNDIGADSLGTGEFIVDRIRHLVLPVFVLSLGNAAGLARFVRGSVLEVIRQDYIRTAQAKGLERRTVIFKHTLRNALLPVVTIVGGSLPALIAGSLLVEVVFALPGMGRVGVEAVFARDYPVIIAVTFLSAVFVVLGQLVSDVLYAVVDPRIKLG